MSERLIPWRYLSLLLLGALGMVLLTTRTEVMAQTPDAERRHNVILRVVRVTPDWHAYEILSGGWPSAVPVKESESLKWFEVAIWEETEAIHMYEFDNAFDPHLGQGDEVTSQQMTAHRESYRIMQATGLPEAWTEERSLFIAQAFIEFTSYIVSRYPDSEHHLMYSGHGGPGGKLFAGQLLYEHADEMLTGWVESLGRPLGMIDMGGPCNKSGFSDLDNFCRHAAYYIASDLPNGGYTFDEWTWEKHTETDPESQFHALFAETSNLQEALVARIDLKRKAYEYSRENMIESGTEQANYLYSCRSFLEFRDDFWTFFHESNAKYSHWEDLYEYLTGNDAGEHLLRSFDDVIVHRADNKDFFQWEASDNGMLMPTDGVIAPSAPRNLKGVSEHRAVLLAWNAPTDEGGWSDRGDSPITGYEYRINKTGTWTAIGSRNTSYRIAGLASNRSYLFELRAVNSLGIRSAPSEPVQVTTAAVLDFAHFANGSSITSDLVFVNVAPYPIRPVIYFFDQKGRQIAADSVVEMTGNLVTQEDGGLTTRADLESLGELTISTHGQGELVTGSARAVAGGHIGGVLRFNSPAIGVAGVGSGSPLRDTIFPVRRQTGGINTGAAIRNLGESPIRVSCGLLQRGGVLEKAEIPLPANGQTAQFIDELFTRTDTSDFVGSVRCSVPPESAFVGVALEMDFQNRIFTTLPMLPVSQTGTQDSTQLYFAHFANGSSITSDLVFVNVASKPILPTIFFYDKEGELMDPATVVDVSDEFQVRGSGLTVQSHVPPLGELTISTHGRGELVTGSVKLVSDGIVGGFLRFDSPAVGVAGVGASEAVTTAIFPARRMKGGINTGAAIRNLGEEAAEITCQLMQNGRTLEENRLLLSANGQTAQFIDEMFAQTDTSDFVGSVRCIAPDDGRFTGVALEMDVQDRIFTTLPMVPAESASP